MTWTEEAPLTEAFAALEAALRAVLDVKASCFSPATAQDAVTAFLRLRHMTDAGYLHLLRVLGEVGSSPSQTARFLRCEPNLVEKAQAARDVEAAKVTDPSVSWDGAIGGVDGDRGALQHLGDALAAGDTSRAHVDRGVRALAKVPTTIRRGTTTMTNTETGEVVVHRNAELLDAQFTRHACSHAPGTVDALAQELIRTLDPGHDDQSFHDPDAAARRGLVVGQTRDGMTKITVTTDPTTAVIVTTALDAASAPLPTQVGEDGELVRDPRSKAQREHDALISLVQAGAATSEPAVAEGARVSVVATVADVQAAVEHRSGQCTATVEGRGPVSTSAFGYLVCGASLQRVLTSPAGAVLDLGRSVRLATPSQRKALAIRDGGCVAPGCAINPWACEAHHFPEWENGGTTDLDTMVLLCPGHHRAWHAKHLEVRLTPARTIEARWVTWSLRWPGHAETHPWVRNTYPADRKLTRELGERLRGNSDDPVTSQPTVHLEPDVVRDPW